MNQLSVQDSINPMKRVLFWIVISGLFFLGAREVFVYFFENKFTALSKIEKGDELIISNGTIENRYKIGSNLKNKFRVGNIEYAKNKNDFELGVEALLLAIEGEENHEPFSEDDVRNKSKFFSLIPENESVQRAMDAVINDKSCWRNVIISGSIITPIVDGGVQYDSNFNFFYLRSIEKG